MTHRQRAISPQLKALGPDIRLLAVFIDAIAAYGRYCIEVQGRVDTAMLVEREDGEGWNLTKTQRLMQRRGWASIDAIYDAADIPVKWRVVVDLDTRGYEDREIARHLDRPLRTVQDQLERSRDRMRRLDWGDELTATQQLGSE